MGSCDFTGSFRISDSIFIIIVLRIGLRESKKDVELAAVGCVAPLVAQSACLLELGVGGKDASRIDLVVLLVGRADWQAFTLGEVSLGCASPAEGTIQASQTILSTGKTGLSFVESSRVGNLLRIVSRSTLTDGEDRVED